MEKKKKAIIIGAGPAGLTAGYEILAKSDIEPVIFEMSSDIGGISKTVNYKGYRMDIGGHRFFSKSERIMKWWLDILPLQGAPSRDDTILHRNVPLSEMKGAPDPEKTDQVMLIRNRCSRIYFMRCFFEYPITLKFRTLKSLGLSRTIKIAITYLKARLFPIKHEKSLEDFLINRFGRELYDTFFRDYTKKVWGVPCDRIKADWGVQRIKGLSVMKTIIHAIKNTLQKDTTISQRDTETSLIGQFMYPKFGPGQLWEEVARQIEEKGGKIHLNNKVVKLRLQNNRIVEAEIKNRLTGKVIREKADYYFSTMPVKHLVKSMNPKVPRRVKDVAEGLVYRDFITIGVLVSKLNVRNNTNYGAAQDIIPDNWIYIQEKEVKLGRLQIYNNWSPYLIKDSTKVWLGVEYFCYEGDDFWSMSDSEIAGFAINELAKIQIIDKEKVIDSTVIRMPKAYPAYFGTYDEFNVIREFVDGIENLFLIGRNGMHRYNNMDHSMLSAMIAVENVINGIKSKKSLWDVNTEQQYHE